MNTIQNIFQFLVLSESTELKLDEGHPATPVCRYFEKSTQLQKHPCPPPSWFWEPWFNRLSHLSQPSKLVRMREWGIDGVGAQGQLGLLGNWPPSPCDPKPPASSLHAGQQWLCWPSSGCLARACLLLHHPLALPGARRVSRPLTVEKTS